MCACLCAFSFVLCVSACIHVHMRYLPFDCPTPPGNSFLPAGPLGLQKNGGCLPVYWCISDAPERWLMPQNDDWQAISYLFFSLLHCSALLCSLWLRQPASTLFFCLDFIYSPRLVSGNTNLSFFFLFCRHALKPWLPLLLYIVLLKTNSFMRKNGQGVAFR